MPDAVSSPESNFSKCIHPTLGTQSGWAAQVSRDDALRGFIYSLLFSVWAGPCWGVTREWWHWWPLAVSVAGMAVYRGKLFVAASRYTDTVEAVFDVYRLELYRSAGWRVPDRMEEPESGAKLTMFLWRGL